MADKPPAELVKELRDLRKGRGITQQKLAQSTALKAALEARSVTELHDRLSGVIQSLGSGVKVQALMNAYGLLPNAADYLTNRRDDFGVANDRHADTIEAYENEMIKELALRIVNWRRDVGRQDIIAIIALIKNQVVDQLLIRHPNEQRRFFEVFRADCRNRFTFQYTADEQLTVRLAMVFDPAESVPSDLRMYLANDVTALLGAYDCYRFTHANVLPGAEFGDDEVTVYRLLSMSKGQVFEVVWNTD